LLTFLTDTVHWWHWIAIGILLIILEMGTGTFITLGFGIAGVVIGLLLLLIPMNFVIQVMLWLLLSIAIITLLFRYFKREATLSSSGQSNQGLDTLGTVTQTIQAHKRGKVHFDHPVLGNTQWHATAEETIPSGERVAIEEIHGQLIKVTTLSHTQHIT